MASKVVHTIFVSFVLSNPLWSSDDEEGEREI